MKKLIPFLALLFALRTQAQFCYVEAVVYNSNTLPYVCLNDTLSFYIYTAGLTYNKLIVHWGDGASDTVPPQAFQYSVNHQYSSPGTYYPYYEVSGPACGDTILEFKIWGYLHPGVQDSTSFGSYNFIIVPDSCVYRNGKAYIDYDNSCSYTPGDFPISGLQVITGNAAPYHFTYTSQSGSFSSFSDTSSPIRTPVAGLTANVSPACGTQLSGSYYVANNNNEFVFTCGNNKDISVSTQTTLVAQTVYRPLQFLVENLTCQFLNNVSVTFHLDNRFIPEPGQQVYVFSSYFGQSTHTPTISGNNITIGTFMLSPLGTASGYLYVRADPAHTTLNDTLCFTVTASVAGDVNPANNFDTACPTVVTSYDPNDKSGICNGRNADGVIEKNQDIIYTIRFQNTGNFPAKDIRIVDTLDTDLNIEHIQILHHSHPMYVQQHGRVLTFYFDNIWLPDSFSNEPQSHGNVIFRIKQKPNLAPLTQIKNFVDIYFDYNEPVRTNTVVSVIESPASLHDADVSKSVWVYPNPTQGELYLVIPQGGQYQLLLRDMLGSVVRSERASGSLYRTDVSNLPDGIYIAEIIRAGERYTMRVHIAR
ncbi:MAG: T9SS type A sorting domain-containing protein [Chitinophagales bacterium]|nr:T9SS type A sorting domain-containing protein [Chitinophagales bacterium]MDW8418857.1 T9SS type A sorting domain-containing protein [Chitinophagales bacterium]